MHAVPVHTVSRDLCLHARSPGPQVIFRLHATNPLMQSSDAVAGCVQQCGR